MGYERFLEALKDLAHVEHASYLEWVGDSFDSKTFALDHVTQQLREGVYWQGELVAPPLTSSQTFTPQGQWFWDNIPEHIQARIMGAVWYPHCSEKTTIVNFKSGSCP